MCRRTQRSSIPMNGPAGRESNLVVLLSLLPKSSSRDCAGNFACASIQLWGEFMGSGITPRHHDAPTHLDQNAAGGLPQQAPVLEQARTRSESASLAGTGTAEMLLRGAHAAAAGAVPALMPGMEALHLLVIDEDDNVLRAICEIALAMGFAVHPARSAAAADEVLQRRSVDVVLFDLLPQDTGLSFLQRLRQSMPRVPIVVMTAFATVNSAVEAMRIGASDYLTKPFAMDELTGTLELAAQRRQFDVESRRLQDRMVRDAGGHGLIGASAAMEKLLRMVAKVAPAMHPVLIVGESGTGKELVAKLIHATSTTASQAAGDSDERPMLSVDCSALPSALLETELFGYVRNEGTGEREERQGLLTQPGGGTLFLREIGSMPLELQARLLRALQERRLRPVGGSASLPVTTRLLASSSRDLPQLVETGQFRRDLYFRLNVVHLRVPPLRERREDIPLLAAWFLSQQAKVRHVEYRLDSEVLTVLDGYDWPGNVRELEGSIEHACSFSSGPDIFLKDFSSQLQGYRHQLEEETLRVDNRSAAEVRGHASPGHLAVTPGGVSPGRIVSIAELEKNAILTAIHSLNGDKLMAAKLLGIGKTTLYRKLKEYGLEE